MHKPSKNYLAWLKERETLDDFEKEVLRTGEWPKKPTRCAACNQVILSLDTANLAYSRADLERTLDKWIEAGVSGGASLRTVLSALKEGTTRLIRDYEGRLKM